MSSLKYSVTPWRKPSSEWDRRTDVQKRAAARETASPLLAERGMEGTILSQIAARSGMILVRLHQLYPSKAHLVDEIARVYLDRLYAALDGAGLDGLPGRERLRVMARALARTAYAERDSHCVLMQALATLPPHLRDGLRTRVAWLCAGVAEAVSLRLPRLARPDAEQRAWQLLLLLAGPPMWMAGLDEKAAEAAADAAVAAVTGARAARPASGASD